MKNKIHKSLKDEIKFNADGLIPAIIQEAQTGEVLMLAYLNEEALEKTLSTGLTHFWSRSRNKLWLKGESSGHFQKVLEIRLDCDGDTLLIKAKQTVGACHTGYYSCFYRSYNSRKKGLTIKGRKVA